MGDSGETLLYGFSKRGDTTMKLSDFKGEGGDFSKGTINPSLPTINVVLTFGQVQQKLYRREHVTHMLNVNSR